MAAAAAGAAAAAAATLTLVVNAGVTAGKPAAGAVALADVLKALADLDVPAAAVLAARATASHERISVDGIAVEHAAAVVAAAGAELDLGGGWRIHVQAPAATASAGTGAGAGAGAATAALTSIEFTIVGRPPGADKSTPPPTAGVVAALAAHLKIADAMALTRRTARAMARVEVAVLHTAVAKPRIWAGLTAAADKHTKLARDSFVATVVSLTGKPAEAAAPAPVPAPAPVAAAVAAAAPASTPSPAPAPVAATAAATHVAAPAYRGMPPVVTAPSGAVSTSELTESHVLGGFMVYLRGMCQAHITHPRIAQVVKDFAGGFGKLAAEKVRAAKAVAACVHPAPHPSAVRACTRRCAYRQCWV